MDTSNVQFFGIIPGDDLQAEVIGEFEDAKEGEGKTVYLTYELSGADAGNYYVPDNMLQPKTAKASIYVKGKGGPDEGKAVKDLPAVTITSAKSAKKAAVVKWKKISKKNLKKIGKIQIQYSTDKKFKKGVKTVAASKTASSKKIKKLKSKKQYYFRVRSYKNVNGVKHVSKWSKVKKAKIK